MRDAAADEDYAEGEEDPPRGGKCDTLVETGSSELGLRFPTLQAIFLGKGLGSASRHRSIICDIMYDIPDLSMMSQFTWRASMNAGGVMFKAAHWYAQCAWFKSCKYTFLIACKTCR